MRYIWHKRCCEITAVKIRRGRPITRCCSEKWEVYRSFTQKLEARGTMNIHQTWQCLVEALVLQWNYIQADDIFCLFCIHCTVKIQCTQATRPMFWGPQWQVLGHKRSIAQVEHISQKLSLPHAPMISEASLQ